MCDNEGYRFVVAAFEIDIGDGLAKKEHYQPQLTMLFRRFT